MKYPLKRVIHNSNQHLSKPISVVIILFVLFAYFAYGNYRFQSDNRTLLSNTKSTVDNTSTLLINLQQAVTDLKTDNQKQTKILCRLILKGNLNLNTAEIQQVEVICNEAINNSESNQTPLPSINKPSKPGSSGAGGSQSSLSASVGASQPNNSLNSKDKQQTSLLPPPANPTIPFPLTTLDKIPLLGAIFKDSRFIKENL